MVARHVPLATLTAAGLVVALAGPALAHNSVDKFAGAVLAAAPVEEGGTAVAMEFIENLQYPAVPNGAEGQRGTDIEFLTLGDKDYALAGTGFNGMQVVDITDPEAPALVGRYDCPINQGDVQVFRQGERVLATYTADQAVATTPVRLESQCVKDLEGGIFPEFEGDMLGTFIVDITEPTTPSTVGFFEVGEGSHNQTIHPSGDYLYNSNSDLLGLGGLPEVTIHDISDPAKPREVRDFTFPPVPTSLGTESHDIFFNADGTRAYVAALSSTLVLDTSKPEDPVILSQIVDPTINVVHQSDLVSLPREDGTVRDLLVITDEQAGAAEQSNCPGGGLHVYDVTGDLETSPAPTGSTIPTARAQKLGTFFIPVVRPAPALTCTSHVLRMYPDQGLMTIGWYTAGVRVLDISGLAETGVDPNVAPDGEAAGLKEVGSFEFPDSNSWSFKTNRIEADGSFYGFSNDIGRGFDVFRFDGAAAELGRTVPVLAPADLAAPGCAAAPVATGYTDRDDAREVHRRSVDCVISRAIAVGSVEAGQRVYRPGADVTRGQMASFIVNALRAAGIDQELPAAPATDAFDDIAESTHRDSINVLAAAGVVRGNGGSYDPEAPVTRDQMASFMLRAANTGVDPDLAGSGGPRFTDVQAGSTHADSIETGADNGLFDGVTATSFAPTLTVKRDQMATFLVKLVERIEA